MSEAASVRPASDVMPGVPQGTRPWAALWTMIIGFFMLMMDTLIVAVANPTIEDKLNTSLTSTIWVTSAYALAIAVPLLVSGRLGDRFGQKQIFMLGMAVFTLGSLGCGLSRSISLLIVMRVIQGIGGSLMTPQTMAMIVRVFPPQRRGAPMGIWGAVSGVAMLIAPVLGGILVDNIGWEWIFFVNVPIGIAGLILAQIFVPSLSTTRPKFDWVGLFISGIGLFLLVFGIQEGATKNWGTLWGPITIWECIAAGAVLIAVFIVWEIFATKAPLVPMKMFRHRDFALSSAAVSMAGFAVTAMPIPLLYYTQIARGYSAQGSALFTLPMAVVTGIFSPLIGARLVPKVSARYLSAFGFLIWGVGIWWYIQYLTPTHRMVPDLFFPAAVIGFGAAFVWTPLSVASVRNLPHEEAGAGSGIYNTVRQVGSVIGAAAVSTLMVDRITTNMTQGAHTLPAKYLSTVSGINQNTDLTRVLTNAPADLKTWFVTYFSPAMAQSLWLPIAAAVIGAVVALFLSTHASRKRAAAFGNIPA